MAESYSNPESIYGSVARYEDDKECFLKALPPPATKRYIYQNSEQFDKVLNLELSARSSSRSFRSSDSEAQAYTDRIIFLIEPASFDHESNHASGNRMCRIKYCYNPATNILTLKMPSALHATVASTMTEIMRKAHRPMGLEDDFKCFAARDVPVGGGVVKVADEGWLPKRTPNGHRKDRPSVVVEVGMAETECELHKDTKMWVNPGQGGANIALTFTAKKDTPLLKIEKWEWNEALMRPQMVQHIEVRGMGGGRISVSRAPLTIPFEQFWMRAADAPRERGIVLQRKELVYLAKDVWGEAQIAY
ncbi:hypothetical protein N7528_005359 [Penicillium herquei]|nr:hypothetical protein N7528_005359 [Penicillium herquei]